MRYGYFDNENREYVIDKPNVPVSWTNYIGTEDMCGCISQNAGGYVFYKSPQHHRITRFRPNAYPLDRPGHDVYIRDDETGDYFSISWQPVGKDLSKAKYECRHGLSYSKFSCDYEGISATQTLFIPRGDDVELWDCVIKNTSDKARKISVFNFCEFSFHEIDIDNQNFQMSLYAAGSSYEDGIIQYNLHYDPRKRHYMCANFIPDSYDSLRDNFIGAYRTESNPIGVERGYLSNESMTTMNHCGSLHKKFELKAGEEVRVVFMLGVGTREVGKQIREKYSDLNNVDKAFQNLKEWWAEKYSALQIQTPNEGMNTLINTWTLYQAETNVNFSRFASFIETGGRTGLGYRDTAQDSMCVQHSSKEKSKQRLVELLRALVNEGYGLHLFDPAWFDPNVKKDELGFKSPTVVPEPSKDSMIHGIKDACSDDALWLIASICEYIKETGEVEFADEIISYADGGEGSVYEHMKKILDFSAKQVGATGICKGLRADWNDCLNLGGGESALVSFLHYWALENFMELATFLGRDKDVKHYQKIADKVKVACQNELWDGEWWVRGITKNGKKIGTQQDTEGKVHMESNTWAVISGVADKDQAVKCMDSVDKYLYTKYGMILNAPSFKTVNDDIGFVTRVYNGIKENGAIFSHPNPWSWVAECIIGRGSQAMKYYDALSPYNQNDMIEIREAEPYSYCQFIYGNEHQKFGKARHPWLTGTAGWAYFAATHYMIGVRLSFEGLVVDPCVPADWKEFSVQRRWRNAMFNIKVENPNGVEKGVKKITLNGTEINGAIPAQAEGSVNEVVVVMG